MLLVITFIMIAYNFYMAQWLIHIQKNCNQGYCKSLNKDMQGFTHQLTVLTSYLPVFTHKSTECSKQEPTHVELS